MKIFYTENNGEKRVIITANSLKTFQWYRKRWDVLGYRITRVER